MGDFLNIINQNLDNFPNTNKKDDLINKLFIGDKPILDVGLIKKFKLDEIKSNEKYFYFINSSLLTENNIIKNYIDFFDKSLINVMIHNKNVNIVFIEIFEFEKLSSIKHVINSFKSINIDPKQLYFINNNYNLSHFKNENLIESNTHTIKFLPRMVVNLMRSHTNSYYSYREKFFVCYNRTPRLHRKILLAYLMKNNLLDDTDWTLLLGDFNESLGMKMDFLSNDDLIDIEDYLNYINTIKQKKSIYELNIESIGQFDGVNWDEVFKNNAYTNSYVNIITETLYNSSNVHITEKSFKPFYYYQLPVFVSSYQHVKRMRENYDLDFFDDVIDHSYDNEKDDRLRFHMIVNEIVRLYSNKNIIIDFFLKNEYRFQLNRDKILKISDDKSDADYIKKLNNG